MGAIRTLLAVLVVVVHAGGDDLFMSPVGVGLQVFYLISGFFISYVLAMTPRYADPLVFYWSRALRLLPTYYVVLLLTLLARLFAPNHSLLQLYRDIPASADAFLAFANAFVFGQDWVALATIEGGRLVFSTGLRPSQQLLQGGVLVPQGWTLALELSFYVVAPFILRDRRRILALLAASIACRVVFLAGGIGWSFPWTHGFFPFELALFLLGALSHQLLLPRWRMLVEGRSLAWLPAAGTAFLVVLCAAYVMVPGDNIAKGLFTIACFVALLPLAFLYQSRSGLDMWIGNLSYPIYIGHFLVIGVVGAAARYLGVQGKALLIVVNVVAAVAFAMLLNAMVASKVEAYRRSLKQRKAPQEQGAAAMGGESPAYPG